MNRDLLVCACKQVKLGTIIDTVKDGASTVEEVATKTGASTVCGGCKGKLTAICENLFKENEEGTL